MLICDLVDRRVVHTVYQMLRCDVAIRRVAHTRVQNDACWCDEPGGCDGRIKIQYRRRAFFLDWIDYEVDRFGHFGGKWLPTLFLTPHVRSLKLQFELSSTHVYQMLI